MGVSSFLCWTISRALRAGACARDRKTTSRNHPDSSLACARDASQYSSRLCVREKRTSHQSRQNRLPDAHEGETRQSICPRTRPRDPPRGERKPEIAVTPCNTFKPHFGTFWRISTHSGESQNAYPIRPLGLQSFNFQGFMAGGPEWNRTTTYGFGGHRPIHWTTGPAISR